MRAKRGFKLLDALCYTIIACSLWFSSPSILAAENQLEMLTEADQIRSSDRAKFNQLLRKIDAAQLTPEQRHLYQYLVAYQHSIKGDFSKAITKLKDLSKADISADLRIRCYASILNIYLISRNWESGLSMINKLSSEDILNAPEQSKINLNLVIAIFYNSLKDYSSALEILNTQFNNLDNPRTNCVANVEKLRSLEGLNHHQMVLDQFSTTFPACDAINENIFKSISVALKARSLSNVAQHEEALALLKSELEVAESTKYPIVIAAFYAQIANIHLLLNDYNKAIFVALRAIEYADKIKHSEQLILAYKVLYKAYAAQGNHQKALEYHVQLTEENQSYWNEEKTKQFAIQRAKYDAIGQEQKISLLDSENTLLKTQGELNKQRAAYNRLALAMVTSALFLIILWAYRHKNAAKKLKVIAEEDALTGIANRYHFNRMAVNILQRCEKNQQPVAYVLFDLDNFKQVNDSYGHPVGDWALREAVKAAVGACRSNDIIGRLGGEEFAILLPNCNVEQAQVVAEKCRLAIAAIDTKATKHSFSISASFGVTDTERCQYSLEKLYACADAALYCSKDNGRNQVYLFSANMLPQSATVL